MTNYRRFRIKQTDLYEGFLPSRLWQCAKDAAVIIAILLGVLAVYGWVQQKDLKEQHKAALKPAMAILAKCLNRGDNLIQIGNEIYICGATPTGVKL